MIPRLFSAARSGCGRVSFPLGFKGRTAVYDGDLRRLRELDPEAVAANVTHAMELAGLKAEGRLVLPNLHFAFVVLSNPLNRLAESGRESIWRAFRVPIFEYLLDRRGNIVARECEIHNGLHVVGGFDPATAALELDITHCECGMETPRLKAA